MTSLSDTWPLFGLQIETPRVTLRPPTDADFVELIEVVRGGVHDPASMPFNVPWTDLPSPERERSALQHWWRGRAEWTAAKWDLTFGVFVDGQPIGLQALHAADFGSMRTVESGSWLGLAWQGQGIGTEMRRAVVHFAFAALGASQVTSGAFVDNIASCRVSEIVGYQRNGTALRSRRGVPGKQQLYFLTKEHWEQTTTSLPVTVSGFEQCREMFGL